MEQLIIPACLFLLMALIFVPASTKLGLGSVIGYLIAGMAMRPMLIFLDIEIEIETIQEYAEFGVVMMLFIIGMQMDIRTLWEMRTRLIGLGALQVAFTTLAIMAALMAFGMQWQTALAIGLILSLSSTAIVLQTLNEKRLIQSDGGKASLSVLLFQDIAFIPILAVIPFLAIELTAAQGGHEHGLETWMETLPAWQQGAVTLGAILAVVMAGKYLTRPIFRLVALTGLRELFTAAALLMVMGIALLMKLVGLSPALGTFVAGVVLASSEYKHELESNIEPFKGLLLGLFFISVGVGINFVLLVDEAGMIVGMTVALVALKALILLALSFFFRLEGQHRWLFTFGLAQAGEFGFVLAASARSFDVIDIDTSGRLLLVLAMSMILAPVLFFIYDRLIAPAFAGRQAEGPDDEIDQTGTVIVVGHGRFGGVVNRLLLAAGVKTIVLDQSSKHLDTLRAFGFKVFFGDAARPGMLHAAGIQKAKMIVVANEDPVQSTTIVKEVRLNHPKVHIVARAHDRNHVYELFAAGAHDIIRETFDGSIRAGRAALEALGVHPYDAELLARDFVDHDNKSIRDLAKLYDSEIPPHENEAYVKKARQIAAEQEAAMKKGQKAYKTQGGRAWNPPEKGSPEKAPQSKMQKAKGKAGAKKRAPRKPKS